MAKTIEVTRELAYAAGADAGNAAMKAAGRIVWSRGDWNVAAATTNKLLDLSPQNHA